MSTLELALAFFIVANPIGNTPAILALLKDFDFEKQKKILFREAMIALLICLFFQFFGDVFLKMLHVQQYALVLTGGIILFLLAIQMIFHKPEDKENPQAKQQPFIVPIATPMITGAGLMSFVMVNAASESNNIKIASAILLAWVGVTLVLVTAPYLQKLIGQRGMAAMEQVMGMVLGLMSMQMLVNGSMHFIKTLNT